jgi:hypothetical protein
MHRAVAPAPSAPAAAARRGGRRRHDLHERRVLDHVPEQALRHHRVLALLVVDVDELPVPLLLYRHGRPAAGASGQVAAGAAARSRARRVEAVQRVLQQPRVRGLAPHEVAPVVHVLVVRCSGRRGDRGRRRHGRGVRRRRSGGCGADDVAVARVVEQAEAVVRGGAHDEVVQEEGVARVRGRRRRAPRPVARGGDVPGEVGARLVAAHGASGDVVGAGGLLGGVEGAEPPPLLGHGVPDLRREPAPRPAPHAAVPRPLGQRVAVGVLVHDRGRRALAPMEVVSVGVEVHVGRVLHGWTRSAAQANWSINVGLWSCSCRPMEDLLGSGWSACSTYRGEAREALAARVLMH